jgi:hypothetical protein
MATQENAASFRAAWDAAVTAYAASRGGSADDVMDSGVDMTSTDVTGLWDLVNDGIATINPNSNITVGFTDGTDTLYFTYDELDNYGATGVFAKFDMYFGPHFKIYNILLRLQVILEDAAIGATLTLPVPAALWTWGDYRTLIRGIAGAQGSLEFSGLVSGLGSDAIGPNAQFPAEPD